MKAEAFEFPREQRAVFLRALRLQWLTIAYLISVIILLYFVLGSSQAVKTVWIENFLSLIPPIMILAVTQVTFRAPNRRFPYGYHRVVSIVFLCASLTLFSVGAWLLIDAVTKLLHADRPSIGGVSLFGQTIWLGWLMLPALMWNAVPAFLLGRAKLPLARQIHDKALFTDAKMNKADWTSSAAAIIGILGIGAGYWWADAVAAAIISLSILRDGLSNLIEVVLNLMDETPKTVDRHEIEPLPSRIRERLERLDWVQRAQVRIRENGHVFFGEALVVVEQEQGLIANIEQATKQCLELDWRLYDFHIVPVSTIPADRSRLIES